MNIPNKIHENFNDRNIYYLCTKQKEMIKINPTKILVLDQEETAEKTASGIFIPTTVKSPTMRGKIIQKGDGTPEIPVVHNVGDTCLFNPRAGQKFEWDGKEYRIVDVAEIFLSGV